MAGRVQRRGAYHDPAIKLAHKLDLFGVGLLVGTRVIDLFDNGDGLLVLLNACFAVLGLCGPKLVMPLLIMPLLIMRWLHGGHVRASD
jgi:hypothetical protein